MAQPIVQRCGVCGELGHKAGTHKRADTKLCSACRQHLPVSDFYWVKRNLSGHYSRTCKPCNVLQSRAAYRRSPESRMRRLFNSARNRAADLGLEFTLTLDWVLAQYERQGGRCFYSGRPMTHTVGPEAISFDRRDPAAGYTTGNVVLSQWRVNDAKSNMTAAAFVALCSDITSWQRVEEAGCGPVEARTFNPMAQAVGGC